MKTLKQIVKCLFILSFTSVPLIYAQESSNWEIFIDEDLNSNSTLTWVQNNGTIDINSDWLNFSTIEFKEKPRSGGPTGGHYLELDANQEQTLSEKILRVTVSAKQPEENVADSFAVAYSTNDVGNSGWKEFVTTPDWQDYSFTYNVRKLDRGRNDYVGILGDALGSNNNTLIRSLKIEVQLPNITADVIEENPVSAETNSVTTISTDASVNSTVSQQKYIVKAGDSLSLIAQDVLGDGTRWPELYEANKDSIDNPSILQIGTELIIPSR